MNAYFDQAAELYDRTRSFSPKTMEKAIRILQREIKDCKLLLDVGVGTGRFAEPLQNIGFEVVGIDISKKMMQKAIEKGLKNLIFADACHLPFINQVFDSSLSVHVLHLIQDWRGALQEIARVTKHALYSILVENPTDTPRNLYKKLMKKHGYDYKHPGLGEWDFKQEVKPVKSIRIDNPECSVSDDLAQIREKAFSYQWDAPEEAHQQAMLELEEAMSKKTFIIKIYLHEWDITDIKNYLK